VEARLFEVFRVSYARLTPAGGGPAVPQWTYGIQVPFYAKQFH